MLLEVRGANGAPAIGARIYLEHLGRRMRRDVLPCTSFASSRDPRVHFGLGGASEVGELEVHWLDGTVERFGPLPVDRVSKLTQGQGR